MLILALDNLTGFLRMQNDPVVSKASELLRLGAMPSPDELKNGKDILQIDISTAGAKLK